MKTSLCCPVLTLRRAALVEAGACEDWLKVFDEICKLRGDGRAPSVRRRNGTSYRDPSRLRIELTPLAWAMLACHASGAMTWLQSKGVLSRANLSRANLSRANLSGARRYSYDPPVEGWTSRDGCLHQSTDGER